MRQKASTSERNLRHLTAARDALRAGITATYDPLAHSFRIPSRSDPSRSYAVQVGSSIGGHVVITCPCRAGFTHDDTVPAGATSCWHAAMAAIEAAALDLLEFDGTTWQLTEDGAALLRRALVAV